MLLAVFFLEYWLPWCSQLCSTKSELFSYAFKEQYYKGTWQGQRLFSLSSFLFFVDCLNTELSILAYWDFWIMALSMLGQLYYLLFNILFCCLLFLIQDNADQNKQTDIPMSTEICICVICVPDLHGHYEAGDFCCLDMSCSCRKAAYMHADKRRAPYGWVCKFSLTCGRAQSQISAAVCAFSTWCTIVACWNSCVSHRRV